MDLLSAYRSLRLSLARSCPVDLAAAAVLVKVDPRVIAEAVAASGGAWRGSVRRPAPEVARLLAEDGMQTDALIRLHDALRDPPLVAPWLRHLRSCSFAAPGDAEKVIHHERDTYYQDTILASGRLSGPDPFGGAESACFDSFSASGRAGGTFYGMRGAGGRTLILVAAGHSKRLFGIWLPGCDLFLDLAPRAGGTAADPFAAQTGAIIIRRLAARAAEYNSALTPASASGGRVARVLPIRSNLNFAHMIFNTYTGLERAAFLGLSGEIDAIHELGAGVLGPVGELFPDLAAKVVAPRGNMGLFDPHPFSPAHILVHPGGYFASAGLRRRIAAIARNRRGGAPVPQGRPLIWIGLRMNDRIWMDQEEAVPRYMNAIWRTHPAATFLLEGFSIPDTAVPRTEALAPAWGEVLTRLQALTQGIAARAERPQQIIDLMGQPITEVLRWAPQVDFHLTPLGTAHHKVAWFSRAPGLIYAPESWAGTAPHMLPGVWQADDVPAPVLALGRIAEAEGVRVRPPRPLAENFILDPDELADATLAALCTRTAE